METVDQLQSIASENFGLLSESGFTKPTSHLMMLDKKTIVQSISLHMVILKSLAELYQFRDGMETLKVASTIKDHKDLLSDFFLMRPVILNAGNVIINMITTILYT